MLHKNLSIMVLLGVLLGTTSAWADDDDYRPRHNQAQNKGNYISGQKAGQIARARVKNSHVKKVEFDHDDRYGAVYEVELVAGGAEYDVKINARTGKVIYVKRDH